MVLFTILHKMRRKRTRSSSPSSSSSSAPSTISIRSSSDDDSTSTDEDDASSSVSTSYSDSDSQSSLSSDDDDRPLRRSGRSAAGKNKKKKKVKRSRRNSSTSKPPRKKLKTMNLNGASSNGTTRLRRRKSVESSVVEKVKKRHREAAAAKLKRQLEQEAQLLKSENTNPAKQHAAESHQNGKVAATKDSLRTRSAASSATTKSSATIPRQNSIASSDMPAKSRPRVYHKADRSIARKNTDPEVVFRLFDKPSRIYQCLAARKHERSMILQRNLSYMCPKSRIHKKPVPKDQRFKLPPKLTANDAVLGDQSNNFLMQSPTSSKSSKRGANARLSSASVNNNATGKQIDPRSSNLNLVLCRVVGTTPDKPNTRGGNNSNNNRKSVGASNGGSKSDSFLIDVVVNRSYVGKNLETKSQVDSIHSKLRVDFTRLGTDGFNGGATGDDEFFSGTKCMHENCTNAPKTVSIDGNLLYPPNGYTQGRATILIRAIMEGAGWVYDIEMEVSRNRVRKLDNGYYSAHFRPINGAEEIFGSRNNNPRLLFAVCWSPAHVVPNREEVFEQLRREIVRIPKTPSMIPLQKPRPQQKKQEIVPSSPTTSSPTRSPSRARIIRVVFWLSDPSAGGPGICASVANPFRCPWCHTVCPHFLSLLRHLRCWHPRFNFVLQAERVARVADILVTLNKRYSCAEEHCHPPTLLADVPLVGVQKPVKRFSNTQIIWIAGKGNRHRNFHKASSTALAEFRRPESDLNPSSMIVLAGHLRTYYHAQTCLPMTLEVFENSQDSDDDEQPWLIEQSWRLLNEFTDVNPGEKAMMHLWNRFMHAEKFFAQRSIFPACLAFVDQYGPEVIANGILGNFRLHLTCLFQNNLLTAPQIYAVMARLQRKMDEMKPPVSSAEPLQPSTSIPSSPRKTVGPSNSATSLSSPAKDRPLRKSISSTS